MCEREFSREEEALTAPNQQPQGVFPAETHTMEQEDTVFAALPKSLKAKCEEMLKNPKWDELVKASFAAYEKQHGAGNINVPVLTKSISDFVEKFKVCPMRPDRHYVDPFQFSNSH